MAKFRDNISNIAIDQEYIEVKEEYIEYIKVEDVKIMLDEIEESVNECIKLFNIDDLPICLERLKDLSKDLY